VEHLLIIREAWGHTHTHTHIHTCTYTHIHTCTHIQTHTHACTHTHTYTHTHTHTHTHTGIQSEIRSFCYQKEEECTLDKQETINVPCRPSITFPVVLVFKNFFLHGAEDQTQLHTLGKRSTTELYLWPIPVIF
jgi:hypothetical protein